MKRQSNNLKREMLENGGYKESRYYDCNCNKKDCVVYVDSIGLWHREDGPAYIGFSNNIVTYIEYCVNNKLHRINGPASIVYYKSGEIKNERYFINNIEYSKEEFYKQPEVIKCRNINRKLKLLNKF